MRRFLSGLLFALTWAILSAAPVAAHGYIVRAIPGDRAVLERSPARAQYWFSEELEPDFSTITVTNLQGEIIAVGGVPAAQGTLLEARLPTGLPDGPYFNELRIAFASDGHVVVERYPFFVGQSSAVTGDSGDGAANLLEVGWRTVLLMAMTLLLGITSLYAFVLVPAWGNPAFRAGLLPPRVLRRVYAIAIGALALAFAANIVALIQQTMTFFGADVGRVLSDGLWQVVRTGTRFGDTWNWRMIVLAIIGGLLFAAWYWRERTPGFIRSFWAAAAWGSVLALSTLSLGGHAAGSNLLPWVALLNDWLHLAAVGLWAGGVSALALVLPAALQPLEPRARREALLVVLHRFSPLAAASLGMVVASGLYSASLWLNRPADIATSYGIALLLKLALIAPLIALGAAHHALVNADRYPRYIQWVERLGGAVRSLRLELVAVGLVLASVGLLSATPVPKPDLGVVPEPPSATELVVGGEAAGLQTTVTITPGGPGINSYDVAVTRDGLPIDDLQVRLQMIEPSLDRRSGWLEVEPAGDGLYIGAGAEIDRAGEWQTVVEVVSDAPGRTLPGQALPGQTLPGRAAYAWDIQAAASVLQQRTPTPIHLLLLAGVLLMIGLALRPAVGRALRQYDLSPVTLTVAAGATAAAIIIFIFGLQLTDQSVLDYEAAINPPPAIINDVLPDGASVERGSSYLSSACAGWQASPEMAELVSRLARTRDQALYEMVNNGFRSLPACVLPDDDARWDVVNAIRALQNRTPGSI